MGRTTSRAGPITSRTELLATLPFMAATLISTADLHTVTVIGMEDIISSTAAGWYAFPWWTGDLQTITDTGPRSARHDGDIAYTDITAECATMASIERAERSLTL